MNKLRALIATALLGFVILFSSHAMAIKTTCTGRFLNPITDICWSCIFPIKIGEFTMGVGEDTGDVGSLICFCPISVTPFIRQGVGVSYWNPGRVVEVVRSPYCSPMFGGTNLVSSTKNPGAQRQGEASAEAYYHAHWMYFPLLAMVEAFTSTLCVGDGMAALDYAYMTELDPLWIDDELSFFINPEAALFASLPAQAACVADCLAATAGFPLAPLFWCAGCNGAIYPVAGTTVEHIGGLQTSLLMTQRLAFKMHRQMLAMDTSSHSTMCFDHPNPILPKNQYKTQVAYPIPQTNFSHPLGRTSSFYGAGQEFPVKGENWFHIIWNRNLCCGM